MTSSTSKADDSHEWTRWLRSAADIGALPDRLSAGGQLLARGAGRLLRDSSLPEPVLVPLDRRHSTSLSAARTEALTGLRTSGVLDGSKINAGVGPAGAALVQEIDVPGVVRRTCGLSVAPPTTATYVGYTEPGHELQLHLDVQEFGDLVLMICLAHDSVWVSSSQTIHVTSAGPLSFDLHPGEALLFDGARTPHGRTGVSGSEQVVSLVLGLTLIGGS